MVTNVLNQTLTANSLGSGSSFTTGNWFAANTLDDSGIPYGRVRLTLTPATVNNDFVISKMYIGHTNPAGDNFDFDTTPVEVTFAGVSGVHMLPGGGDKVSDIIDFAFDPTKELLIFYEGPSSGSSRSARSLTGLGSNVILYFKTGVNEAATVNKSSYSQSTGRLDFIRLIEAFHNFDLTADLVDDEGIAATITLIPPTELTADIADDLGITATLFSPGTLNLTADLADDLGIDAAIQVHPSGELEAHVNDDLGIDAVMTVTIKPQPVQCIVIAV